MAYPDPDLARAQSDAATLDPWSPLTHKRELSQPRNLARLGVPTSWTGDHARRLTAYRILAAYQRNVARDTINAPDDTSRREHREYGDGALLVAQAVSALLGDRAVARVVETAAEEDPLEPQPPDPLPADASPQDQAGFDLRQRQYEREHARWIEQMLDLESAVEFQEWLTWWCEREQFDLKLVETERNAVGLGDGLYLVSWSNSARRPRLHCYDPGFYFPVLSTEANGDYPETVHLAWEYEAPGRAGETSRFVRRITFRLGPIMPLTDPETGEFVYDDAGGFQTVGPADRWDPERGIVRELPWESDDGDGERAETTTTCYMTDATWELAGLNGGTVEQLTDLNATYAVNEDGELVRDLDLGVDFVPVVHVPNTSALLEHYGTSVLSLVAQVLDDLAGADTDLQVAAGTTGAPPISISGGAVGTGTLDHYGPGTVFWTGEGRMDVLDTSRSLDALLKYVEQLLHRLSTNSRLPEEVLGRVRVSDVPSGIALALSFGPFQSLIRELRLARRDKYRLLFRMVQRFAMLGGAAGIDSKGALPPGRTHKVDLQFGSFLPADTRGVVEMIVTLLQQHGLSRLTALRLLSEAGLNVGDWHDELLRIQQEDFSGAGELADATGRDQDAQRYLGLEVDPDTGPAFPTIDGGPLGAPGGAGFPFGTPPPAPGEGDGESGSGPPDDGS